MSRRRGYEHRRGKTVAPFVQLHMWLLRSPAWRALDGNSRSAYVELKSHFTGENNGTIGLSVRQCGAALGVSFATASRALQKLADHGFIVATSKGTVGTGSGNRHAATWLLTESPDNRTGEKATKDFLNWRPLEEKTSVAKTASDVARVKRGGNGIPQTSDERCTGETSKPENDDPTFHGCNTLTSSHRHGAAQPSEVARPSKARVNEAGQAGGSIPVSDSLRSILSRDGANARERNAAMAVHRKRGARE